MSLMNTYTQLLVMAPLVGGGGGGFPGLPAIHVAVTIPTSDKLVGDLLGRPLSSKLLSAILTRTFLIRPSSPGSTSSSNFGASSHLLQ